MGIPHIRRASEEDSGGIAALIPGLVPSATDLHHATFVIDGVNRPVAVLDLLQGERHLELLYLVAPSPDHARALQDFAEAAARAFGAREIRLPPGSMNGEQSRVLGYRKGVRRIPRDGVLLWRDGTAPLAQTLYLRGVWAALALLAGLGSVTLAVFSGSAITLAHIVVPALLCAVGSLFAFWQILLVVLAAARRSTPSLFALSAAVAAATVLLTGALLYGRATPALTELWNIHNGDAALANLAVTVSKDGYTLHVSGAYGIRSEELVRQALEQHKSVRVVALEGPGGRASAGIGLFRMIRKAKLATRVDTACASACTIAFLGGVERTVSPGGRLGFHRASFPGMDEDDMHESNRGMRNFLVSTAGLTPEFARRVIDTPSGSIWVPTREELLAGKVITR